MNIDDMKQAWQSESGISQERFEQIGAKVSDSTRLLQKSIFRRDMAETFASAFVIVAFALMSRVAKTWIDWAGCWVAVVAGFIIPMVLWWARKRPVAIASAANFRDFVDVEVDYLRRQVLIIGNVAWWYLLPLYVAVALIIVGMMGPEYRLGECIVLGVCLAMITALYVYLWWLNQVACKKRLQPLHRYYADMAAALESGDDSVLPLSDPPIEFLHRKPPVISKLRRWVGGILTVIATLLVIAGGIVLMQRFDQRTGRFVMSTAPVVAILVITCTGIWRRNPAE